MHCSRISTWTRINWLVWIIELECWLGWMCVASPLYSSHCIGQLLSLNSNNLSDLPSSLSQLNNLEWLNLDHNMFSSIPTVVFTLTSMKVLTIHNQWPVLHKRESILMITYRTCISTTTWLYLCLKRSTEHQHLRHVLTFHPHHQPLVHSLFQEVVLG